MTVSKNKYLFLLCTLLAQADLPGLVANEDGISFMGQLQNERSQYLLAILRATKTMPSAEAAYCNWKKSQQLELALATDTMPSAEESPQLEPALATDTMPSAEENQQFDPATYTMPSAEESPQFQLALAMARLNKMETEILLKDDDPYRVIGVFKDEIVIIHLDLQQDQEIITLINKAMNKKNEIILAIDGYQYTFVFNPEQMQLYKTDKNDYGLGKKYWELKKNMI